MLPPLIDAAMNRFGLFWLVLGRVGGALYLAPVVGSQFVPAQVKAPLVALISLAILPLVRPPAGGLPGNLLGYAALEVHELVLGLGMGYLARLVITAAEVAGAALDVQLGFGLTAVMDPLIEQPTPVIGSFFGLLALLAFVLAGGHRLLIEALAVSYARLPVGGGVLVATGVRTALDAFAWMFVAAVELAVPLIGLGLLVTVCLGVLGRAVPQLNVLVGVLPVQVLAGIALLIAVLPALFAAFAAIAPQGITFMSRLIGG